MESAAIVPVADLVYPDDIGRKVRVAGLYVKRLTRSCSSYDTDTGELWLEHERACIAVDLTLVLEAGTHLDLHPKSKWMCIGTLEQHRGASPALDDTSRMLSSPSAHAQKRAWRAQDTRVSAMVVRAIFAKRVDSLDLRVWAQAARAVRSAA